jgi:hypothetical protein
MVNLYDLKQKRDETHSKSDQTSRQACGNTCDEYIGDQLSHHGSKTFVVFLFSAYFITHDTSPLICLSKNKEEDTLLQVSLLGNA